MKSTLLLTVIMIASLTSSVAETKLSHIRVISKRMDCFYFKVDKEFIGAEIEVYSEKGEKVITQTVETKRTIIDFYYLTPGTYTITISKGGEKETFDYYKTTALDYVPQKEETTEAIKKVALFEAPTEIHQKRNRSRAVSRLC